MSKDQPEGAIEMIETASGLKVYGPPITDKLGNRLIVHESSVPADEGGPFVWVTLQQAGETEGVGVLLDEEQLKTLILRVETATEEMWG